MPATNISKLDGLTPKQAKFAQLLAQGENQGQAYRLAFKPRGRTDQAIYEAASKQAAKPEMRARVKDLLQAAKVSDLDSVAQAYKDLLGDIQSARAAENWTAVAALSRLRLQVQGMLKDTVTVTAESRLSDENIVNALAKGNPEQAAALKALLGAASFH